MQNFMEFFNIVFASLPCFNCLHFPYLLTKQESQKRRTKTLPTLMTDTCALYYTANVCTPSYQKPCDTRNQKQWVPKTWRGLMVRLDLGSNHLALNCLSFADTLMTSHSGLSSCQNILSIRQTAFGRCLNNL